MESSTNSCPISIKLHHGGYFAKNPLVYEFEMVTKIDSVDMIAMNYSQFVSFVESKSHAICKRLFFCLPGKDLQVGLRPLTCDTDMTTCMFLALSNVGLIDIYVGHSDIDPDEVSGHINSRDNEGGKVEGSSECEDEQDKSGPYYVYCSDEDDEDETASLDHLSEGEDEVVDVRTKRAVEVPVTEKKKRKMFDEMFLAKIYEGLDREKYVQAELKNTNEDKDKEGENWPIHNPKTKWKLMMPQLGEKYEGPDQLKRCLAFYALAHGYKLFYKVNDYGRLLVKCSKDENGKTKCPFRLWASWMQKEKTFQIKTLREEHCCSRSFEFGSLITCNWIARNFAKKLMINPKIKVKELQEEVLRKYNCKVSFGQAKRGKKKALEQYEGCLEDHYGKLWSYAQEIRTSNPGSTCLLRVDVMPNEKNYFKSFYVCFKGLKEGWLEGCRRVIGLDGCFLKTSVKGQLLSAVGRDGNNHVYPIAWAVVNVENKESWKWFMECLIEDLGLEKGHGITIISDQHKGIIEAAKDVMPLAHHRQCARHIYANFRKRYSGVLYRNLFWKAAKASYPTQFEKVMNEIKAANKDAHKYLMEKDPKTWSRAFFNTDVACDAVENGISECFNSLIVDARKKPIINMLEDIRHYIMDRMKNMREKHEKWTDEICPSIRKKFELIKGKHRDWKVIHSQESKFEVINGFEGFKVDEMSQTCSCRQWQLTGMPCEHGIAAIYKLHKDPDFYVANWYKKPMFFSAYNHCIYPLSGMSQWAPVDMIKPLPPKVRRMPGRPKQKRRRDVSEGGNENRNRVSRVGRVMHCKNCKEEGHNKKTCNKEPAAQTQASG